MSYKALRTSDPAHLTPWLMYWVVLSLLSSIESTFYFILGWIPFYAWFRLFLHAYLILPGIQGATPIYQDYIHPFLLHHELEIDQFIGDAHAKMMKAGLQYAKMAVEWVKVNLLGGQARPDTPPERARQGSYAQQLFSQFNMPTARQGFAAPAGDFVGLLSSALQYTTSKGQSREDAAQDLQRSGTLIPENLSSTADRMSYISAQRERLNVLLSAFDREAYNLSTAPPDAPPRDTPGADLSKSRSEADFFKVEKDGLPEQQGQAQAQGSWMPWNWNRTNSAAAASAAEWVRDKAEDALQERKGGRSSGYENDR